MSDFHESRLERAKAGALQAVGCLLVAVVIVIVVLVSILKQAGR